LNRLRIGVVAGALTSVALICFFVSRLDWRQFAAAFSNLHWGWISLTASALLLSILIRSVRWMRIIQPTGTSVRAFWHSTVIGYFGNMVYPARAGEVLRLAAVYHLAGISPGRAVASSFIDRLFDLLFLSITTAGVVGIILSPQDTNRIWLPLGLIALIPTGILFGFIFWGEAFLHVIEALSSVLPNRWHRRLLAWYLQAMQALQGLNKIRVVRDATILTACAMLMDYSSVWFATNAMGWHLSFLAGITVAVTLTFGTLLPAAPGYIGVYQVAAVLGLKPFGVDESSAIAFSLILQAALLVVVLPLGSVLMAHYGLHLSRRI
jgi:uncharacterized protein (TIRG00374 family)